MRATLKKWGIVFWEWLITGVAFGLGVLLVAALFLGICASFADAAQAQTVTIPRAAYQHRDTLIRASRAVWGLDAPHALHGEMAPHGCAGSGRARAVQSRLGAPGVRHL